MNRKEQMRKSKQLALWLRHKPELICNVSEVRDGGWIPINFVVKGGISMSELVKIVEDDDKGRYEIDEVRMWVRACQGHSIKIDMDYKEVVNIPEKLYHGTVEKFLGKIFKEGLKPMSRTHVHLSKDFETASKVGSRRGEPIILEIDSENFAQEGNKLYIANNGVYLCSEVDPKFIKVLY